MVFGSCTDLGWRRNCRDGGSVHLAIYHPELEPRLHSAHGGHVVRERWFDLGVDVRPVFVFGYATDGGSNARPLGIRRYDGSDLVKLLALKRKLGT
jgi:hypothetical protein